MATTTLTKKAGGRPRPAGQGRTAGVGRLAAMLVSPTFLVIALVIGYPLIEAIRLSFFKQSQGVDPATGIVQTGATFGIQNYAELFSGDTGVKFYNALWSTTTFTVVGVGIETVLGICMALIMHRAFRGRGLIRASILVPWAVPTAMSALLWQFIFQADGIANNVLGTQILWTSDGFQSWVAILIADIWKTSPFIGLITLAGLQVIPAEVYEAAKIDGASAWSTFTRITLPLVKPALVVAVLFRMMDVLRLFDLPYVMLGSGKQWTDTLSVMAFLEAVKTSNFGAAGAISTILFAYIAIAAFIFVKVLGADVISSRPGGK